ncbi:hypothetical protein Gorai_021648, partial [Gossypium raimondii]|nr:hypothetical protein [Gossypium raimondii]
TEVVEKTHVREGRFRDVRRLGTVLEVYLFGPEHIWACTIMLPRLSGGMCTNSLLQFIGSVIGLVVKIDRNIDNSSRGKFSRLAVYVDLGKPLVSKVKNDGKTQRVEFGALNVNHKEEKRKQSCGLDGINESRKLGAQDAGIEDMGLSHTAGENTKMSGDIDGAQGSEDETLMDVESF